VISISSTQATSFNAVGQLVPFGFTLAINMYNMVKEIDASWSCYLFDKANLAI